jgi:enoyl-CoA hydratase
MTDLVVDRHLQEHYMVFRLNRPDKLNAVTPAMMGDLEAAVDELSSDARMRVGILIGTGRAFSAGADLSEMGEDTGGRRPGFGDDGLPLFPFAHCPKPVIAAVNGLCVSGGLELACDCDVRIASTEAYFGAFEASRGILAGVAVQHLARVMPAGEAMKLLLSCDRMPAERAHQIGFVQELAEPEAVLDRAAEMAHRIGKNAPLAVEGHKAMVQFWRHYAIAEARQLERQIWPHVYGSVDAGEGQRAFAEKRAPRWKTQ